MQILKDTEDISLTNSRLEQLGYTIGKRAVDEYAAKTKAPRCRSFQQALAVLTDNGLNMFLGQAGVLKDWAEDKSAATLAVRMNVLERWVDLPSDLRDLRYSNLLAGAVRGALEVVKYKCQVEWISDALQGDTETAMRVTLLEEVPQGTGADYAED